MNQDHSHIELWVYLIFIKINSIQLTQVNVQQTMDFYFLIKDYTNS